LFETTFIQGTSPCDLIMQANEIGSSVPKIHKNGTWTIDPVSRTLENAKTGSIVHFPKETPIETGVTLTIRLRRNGSEKEYLSRVETLGDLNELTGKYLLAGKRTSGSSVGKKTIVYKFPVYFTHPGMPELKGLHAEEHKWIHESASRLFRAQNNVARDFQKAIDLCSPYTQNEMQEYGENVLAPAIDAFNNSLGRELPEVKLTYPKGLGRKDTKEGSSKLTFSRVRSFNYRLGMIFKESQAIFEVLSDKQRKLWEDMQIQVSEFAAVGMTYEPINEMRRNVQNNIWFKERYAVLSVPKLDDKGTPVLNDEGRYVYEQPTGERLLPNTLSSNEIHQLFKSIKSTLEQRSKVAKTRGYTLADGWPSVKRVSSGDFEDFTLYRYGNSSNALGGDLEACLSTPLSLQFGPKMSAKDTSHGFLDGEEDRMTPGSRNSKRVLRQVTLRIPSQEHSENRKATFAILQHRSLADGDVIKAFELVRKGSHFWLCLTATVEAVEPLPVSKPAAFHVGWRSLNDDTIQIGTLILPNKKEAQKVNLYIGEAAQEGQRDRSKPSSRAGKSVVKKGTGGALRISDHAPITVSGGASRWGRSNVSMKKKVLSNFALYGKFDTVEETLKSFAFGRVLQGTMSALRSASFPDDRKQADALRSKVAALDAYLTDSPRGIRSIQTIGDIVTDCFKSYLSESLPDAPAWLLKSRSEGLTYWSSLLVWQKGDRDSFGREISEPEAGRRISDPKLRVKVREIRKGYLALLSYINQLHRYVSERSTARRKTVYFNLAHAICHKLVENNVTHLVLGEQWVAQALKEKRLNKGPALTESDVTMRDRNSKIEDKAKRNRQFVAPSDLESVFKAVAYKHGITVTEVELKNVSIFHHPSECRSTVASAFAKNPFPKGMENAVEPGNSLVYCRHCDKHYDQDENAAHWMIRKADIAQADSKKVA
jgi:hypothetical protein